MPIPFSPLKTALRVHVFTLYMFAALAMLAVSTGACSSARKAVSVDADPTLRAIDEGYRSTPDMTIEGTVKVSGIPATVWFDGVIRARDSMKITLVGPFGIALGAMSATRTGFEFYKADEDIVILGEPNRATFEKLLMIPLDYDELIALLRGEIPRMPASGEYSVTTVESELVYTVRREDFIEEITIDPNLHAVLKYERWRVGPPRPGGNPSDTLNSELQITYSGFATFGARQLARRASVEVAGGRQRIAVTIDEVAASIAPDATFSLEIPDGVERRRFRP